MHKRHSYRIHLQAIALSLVLILAAFTGLAHAEDWPKGYVVYTQSPDNHYGILVPSVEAAEENEALGQKNYFANLKTHRLLGKISGADYFANQNHRGLKMVCPDDASWCVVQYDDRFGFSSISVIEPKGAKFEQLELGDRIQKTLAGAMKAKGDPDAASGGVAFPYYRFDHGKILIRAMSTTDPKQLDPKHGHYAFFRGAYDVAARKWLSADARPLTFEQSENSETALEAIDETLAHTEFQKEEDKYQSLDDSMNAVYGFLHTILPSTQFITVKKEQIEWLKTRDAAATTTEKCALLQARIKALQELIW